MLTLTVEIEGNEEGDIEIALEEIKAKVTGGFTSGSGSNESGRYTFEVTGTPVSEEG